MVNATQRPLYSQERPGTHCAGGWVGLRDPLVRFRTLQPVASRYTNCTVSSALMYWHVCGISSSDTLVWSYKVSKGIPPQAEVAQGVPGRLRPRIFSTFGTTRVVGRQSNAPASFTPGEIPGTHFQRLSRPQGTWFCRKEPRKKSQVTPPGIDSGTVRLNHYATPGPMYICIYTYYSQYRDGGRAKEI